MKPRAYKHRPSICAGCGAVINGSSDPNAARSAKPRPGDLTVTICCGTILRFDEVLRLVVVTPEELEKLPRAVGEELLAQKDRWMAYHGKRTRIGIAVPDTVKPS